MALPANDEHFVLSAIIIEDCCLSGNTWLFTKRTHANAVVLAIGKYCWRQAVAKKKNNEFCYNDFNLQCFDKQCDASYGPAKMLWFIETFPRVVLIFLIEK